MNWYSNYENSWIRSCHKHPLCHLQPHSDVHRALLTAARKLPAGSILPITCLDDHIKTLFSSECLSPGCRKSVGLLCRFLSIRLEWNGPLHKNGVAHLPFSDALKLQDHDYGLTGGEHLTNVTVWFLRRIYFPILCLTLRTWAAVNQSDCDSSQRDLMGVISALFTEVILKSASECLLI